MIEIMNRHTVQKKLKILHMPPRSGEYVDVGLYYSELANRVRRAGFNVEITPDRVDVYCEDPDGAYTLTGNERARFMDDAVNLRANHVHSLSLKDAIYGWSWSYARRVLLQARQSLESAT